MPPGLKFLEHNAHANIYNVLRPGTTPVFFEALEQVEKIQRDCRDLLPTHQYQRVGMQIVKEMSEHQSKAYEKLFYWLKSKCDTRLSHGQPEVDPILQEAVAKLTKKQDGDSAYQQHAKEIVVQVFILRKQCSCRQFIRMLFNIIDYTLHFD